MEVSRENGEIYEEQNVDNVTIEWTNLTQLIVYLSNNIVVAH